MAIFSGIIGAAVSAWTAVSSFIGGLGAIGSFVLQTAAGIGISLIGQAVAGKPAQPSFSITATLQAGGDLPRSILFGEYSTAGSLEYANTWGQAGKTENAFATQVIQLADLPIRALAEVWVNGERCTLAGEAHPDYGFPVLEYRKDGNDYLWIKFYDGTQTAADPFLVSTVSSPERPYSDKRIGRGCPYVIATALITQNLFSGIPSFKFVTEGTRWYDPSRDSSVGGVGPQRWEDPTTWGGDGDFLPAVHAYNLLRGISYGERWLYGLQNVSAAQVPAAHWIGQIEKCRAAIDSADGPVPTYRAGGEVEVNVPIGDAIDAFLTTCQGKVSEAGGVYKLHCGAPDGPVASFTDDDILSSEEQSFTPFFGLADTINGIAAKYPSPADGWNMKVAPPIYRADLEALAGNRRLMADVTLDFVPYAEQVQRLMKSALEEAQRARRHTFVLPPEFWVLEPGDIVSWSSARNGYVDKLFRVDGVVDRANLDVMVDLTEVDPADYDWDSASEFQPPVTGALGPVRPQPQVIVDWFAQAWQIDDASGTGRRPAIRLSWDGAQPDLIGVAFEVALAATGEVIYRGRTDEPEAGVVIVSQGLLPGETYLVRGRYLPRSDRDTAWSGWLPVTTLDIAFGPNDILDGAIGELKLADDAVSTAKLQVAAVTQDIIAANAVIASKIAALAVTAEKVAQNAITVDKIVNGAVTSAKIQDAAISLTKFASGIQPVNIIAGTTVPTTKTTEVITVSGKLYRWSGTAYVASVPAVDVTGQLTNSQIGDAAISEAKIAVGAVTQNLIGNGAVVAAKLADLAVTNAKIADLTIAGSKIQAGAIDTVRLADGAATSAKIGDLAVTAAKLGANAVTETKINDGAISTPKLQANSVAAGKIAAGVVTARELIVADYTNLVPDDQMLGGQWTASPVSPTYATSDPTQPVFAFDSVLYAIVDAPVGSSAFVQSAWFPVKPGEELNLSAQVSGGGDTVAPHRYALQVVVADSASGSSLAQLSFIYVDNPSATAIVRHSVDVTVPANRKFMAFRTFKVAETGGTRLRTGGFIVRRRATASLIVDGAVIAAKVAAGAIETAALAAGAVTSAKIIAGAVDTNALAANAVVAGKVATNAITSEKIDAGAVTAAKIQAGSITGDRIAASAITSTEIAANAVTAAKLAANAVTADKIEANAVTAGKVAAGAINTAELAAGAITTAKLAIGFGGNLLYNADFSQGVDHWQVAPNAAGWGAWTFEKRPSGASWGGFTGTLMLFQPNGDSTGYLALLMDRPDLTGAPAARVPVAPGETLEFSVYLSSHRCACSIQINWYDANGTLFASAVSPTADVGASDQNNPDLWPRVVVQGTAPAGAVSARPVIFKLGTLAGQPNSYLFIHKPMLARVPENATEAAPWANSGGTMVDANGIVANAVTASKIASNTITAAQIAANTITAGQIATGAVAADEIAANAVIASKILAGAVLADKIGSNAVTADKIAANAVTADKILAGAVTAAKISVGSLAAISAVLGNVDISSANIGTLMVGTSNITFQSLTEPTAFGNVGSNSIERAWTTVATLNLPRIAGAFVQVDGYIQCVTGAATSSRASISARLFRVDTNQQVWYETTGTRQGTGSGNGGTTINITRDFALDASSTPAGQTAQYVIQIENPNMSNGNSYWDIQVKVLYWKA